MGVRLRSAVAILTGALMTAPPGAAASRPIRQHCLGLRVTIKGTSADDRLVGTPGRDVIHARGGDDVVLGGDAGDRICGGTGNDELHGRYGADWLKGGQGDDRAVGGPGDDLALGGEGNDDLEGGHGNDSDTLVGGPDGDHLAGGDGRFDEDFLFGGDGPDGLDGGLGGRDSLYGGRGDDVLRSGLVSFEFSPAAVVVDLGPHIGIAGEATGEGDDLIIEPDGVVGSDFGDVVTDGDASRTFRGRGGADAIVAAGGDDLVDGGPGDDDLDGGDGRDLLELEDSPTGVTVTLRDRTSTGGGTDVLAGFENVAGSFFDDHVTGDDGPNSLSGSYGRNAIFGLDGDDVLVDAADGDAGAGDDECWLANVASCESHVVADPPSLPFVADPVHLAELDELETIRGGIAGGLGRPNEDAILVGVRRMTPEGCSWWDASSRRFVLGGCGVFLANEVPLSGRDRWELRVGAALEPGAYRIRANWHDGSYHASNPCSGAFEPVCIELDVD